MMVLSFLWIGTAHAQAFKSLGTASTAEGGHVIIPSSTSGNFIYGGHYQNQALIGEVNSSGVVQWTYTFDVKSTEIDRVFDLRIDSQGKLIGCGGSSDSKYRRDAFAFRFDLGTNSLDWVYETNGSTSTTNGEDFMAREIHDLPGTGEVLLINTVRDYSATDNKTNAGILKLNRTTGAVIANSAIQYSNTNTTNQDDNFNASVLIGNQLYLAGRANLDDPNGLRYSRMIYSQIDIGAMGSPSINGNYGHVDHSRYYISDLSTLVTEYGSSIVVENGGDDIAILGHSGYNSGSSYNSSTNTKMLLMQQSLTNLSDHGYFEIDITGTVRVQTFKLLETVDGYVICAVDLTNSDKYYLIRLTENGSGGYNVTWAKSYSGFTSVKNFGSNNQQALIDNGFIYMIGDAVVNGSRDVILLKVDLSTGESSLNPTNTCENDVTVTIASDSYAADFTYDDPGDIYTHNNPSISASSVTFSDGDICQTSTNPCDYSVKITSAPIDACSYQFSGAVTGGVGPFYYHWDFGDGTTSTDPNPIHRYTTAAPPQTFTVTLTVYSYHFNGVEFECCAHDDQVQVTIDERCDPCPDEPSFTYKELCCGVFEFNGSIDGYTALFWDFGDGNTAAGQNVVHNYGTPNGNYVVTLTAMYYDGENCCVRQVSEVVQYDCEPGAPSTSGRAGYGTPTELEGADALHTQEGLDDDIRLYPNPTSGMVSINHLEDVHTIAVIDQLGREIMKVHTTTSAQTDLNLSELNEGMYFIVISGDETTTKQLIKE